MKKNSFITIFIIIHIPLIFLQVHKHITCVKNNYVIQEYERRTDLLNEKKQILMQELHALKNRENIKKYACTVLNMRPYSLGQIKKLNYDSSY